MTDLQEYLDEDGVLHMCKICRSVHVAGDPSNKIMITYIFRDPPEDTNFVICPECI